MDKYNNLNSLQQALKNDFGLTPCIGAELEFYLIGLKDQSQLGQLAELTEFKIKPERGINQYEIDLSPSTDAADYAALINDARKKLHYYAEQLKLEINFSSKPFENDYGSSMHIHLNFLEDNEIEKYAQILCHYLPQTIDAFLPSEADYARLDSRFMAPTHICYGGNNRTVLIRIPDSLPKRLEHRLPAANCEPEKVISAILTAIYWGLTQPEKTEVFNKIYGNAYEEQYKLRKIHPFQS